MKTKVLHFDKTIMHWDEALPLGNGDLGCLIWNSSDKLRFSLDKGGIWDCSKSPENQTILHIMISKILLQTKNKSRFKKNMMIVTAIRHQPNCR